MAFRPLSDWPPFSFHTPLLSIALTVVLLTMTYALQQRYAISMMIYPRFPPFLVYDHCSTVHYFIRSILAWELGMQLHLK